MPCSRAVPSRVAQPAKEHMVLEEDGVVIACFADALGDRPVAIEPATRSACRTRAPGWMAADRSIPVCGGLGAPESIEDVGV